MPARVAAEIAALPEPRGPMRRLCGDLARRIRLLAPLLQQLQGALPLADALGAARDLLRAVHDGSKIYQVPCSSRLSRNQTTAFVIISSTYAMLCYD
jgi:hypothetical protein